MQTFPVWIHQLNVEFRPERLIVIFHMNLDQLRPATNTNILTVCKSAFSDLIFALITCQWTLYEYTKGLPIYLLA